VQNKGEAEVFELIQRLAKLEGELPISVLRSEAYVLGLIRAEPGHAVKYYLGKSGLSHRGFYNVLRTLLDRALISEEAGHEDRRQKILR
jgi:hypothetical protein